MITKISLHLLLLLLILLAVPLIYSLAWVHEASSDLRRTPAEG